MAVIVSRSLDLHRAQWVSGHLDYQRAAEALAAAEQAMAEVSRRARAADGADADGDRGALDDDGLQRAQSDLERARRHLAEVAAILGGQFDRFCGVTR